MVVAVALALSKKNWLTNVHFRNIVEVKQQMVADLSFVKKGEEKKKSSSALRLSLSLSAESCI